MAGDSLIKLVPEEIVRRNGGSFDNIYASTSPSGDSYVRFEMLVSWPRNMNNNMVYEQDEHFRAAAANMKEAFNHAINELRKEDEKFVIDANVSHELHRENETVISLFVWAPDNNKKMPPEEIKEFLQKNQKQIGKGIREFHSSAQGTQRE